MTNLDLSRWAMFKEGIKASFKLRMLHLEISINRIMELAMTQIFGNLLLLPNMANNSNSHLEVSWEVVWVWEWAEEVHPEIGVSNLQEDNLNLSKENPQSTIV